MLQKKLSRRHLFICY